MKYRIKRIEFKKCTAYHPQFKSWFLGPWVDINDPYALDIELDFCTSEDEARIRIRSHIDDRLNSVAKTTYIKLDVDSIAKMKIEK